jgi:hypothetical protein
MKLLLVLGSSDIYGQIADYVKDLGAEIIHYQHILKAMDNIDEIAPDGIIVSATDFPRHWKTLISFIRSGGLIPRPLGRLELATPTKNGSKSPQLNNFLTERASSIRQCLEDTPPLAAGRLIRSEHPPEVCATIVLYGPVFPDKERKKAKFLNVDCLLSEAHLDKRSLNRLREVLRPYISAVEWVNHLAVRPKNPKKLAMIITNPLTGALINGKVTKISQDGVVFIPEQPRLTKNLTLMAELHGCSLRTGSVILDPVCRVIRNEESLTLEFAALKPYERRMLHKFLKEEETG